MNSIKKILIIGKGTDIVKTFYYVFKNNQVSNISFREAWKNPKQIKKFDIILISGFHHHICELSEVKFLRYVDKYLNFIYQLKQRTNEIYLISTDLSIKRSISRVVFFYYLLNKKIFLRKNVKIISFHTLYGHKKNILEKIKINLLKILKIQILYYKEMIKVVSRKKIQKNNNIKFYFIKYPRPRFIDRLLRLLIDLYLFKFFKN